MSEIKLYSLGGVQEVGNNCYMILVDDKKYLLDSGCKIPVNNLYGIDKIIPDINHLKAIGKIDGIFLTNPTIEYLGSIYNILKVVKSKVYTTSFIKDIIKNQFTEKEFKEIEIIIINSDKEYNLENIKFKFIQVSTPSIIGNILDIKTKKGHIVYAPFFNFDNNNLNINYSNLFLNIASISSEKVIALLVGSNGIYAQDSSQVSNDLYKLIDTTLAATNQRIIFLTYSNDLKKINTIIELAIKYNKKISILGQKTQKLIKSAMKFEYLKIPSKNLHIIKDINDISENSIVIVPGERHEPFFMLDRITKGYDKLVKINKSDKIVLLTPPEVGVEKISSRMLNNLYKINDNIVIYGNDEYNQNASNNEIKQLINVLNPNYIIPINGEYRHQYEFLNLIKDLKISKDRLFILDKGFILEYINDKMIVNENEKFELTHISTDGNLFESVSSMVIKDREILSQDGFIIIVCPINPKTKKIIGGIKINTKGFYVDKSLEQELFDKIKEDILKIIKTFEDKKKATWSEIKNEIKLNITKMLQKHYKKNPVIIPLIVSINKK